MEVAREEDRKEGNRFVRNELSKLETTTEITHYDAFNTTLHQSRTILIGRFPFLLFSPINIRIREDCCDRESFRANVSINQILE